MAAGEIPRVLRHPTVPHSHVLYNYGSTSDHVNSGHPRRSSRASQADPGTKKGEQYLDFS